MWRRLDPLAVRVAARTVLQRLAREQTVVVAIDDVQWVDAASAAVLEFGLRRLEDENVLVFLARRSGKDTAGTALVPAFARHLAVRPLSLGALHRLLVARLGRPFSRAILLRLHATSGGNPFYALELARVLAALTEPPDPSEPLPVPETLHELVRDRLAALPAKTQTALLAVCALADPTATGLRRLFPDVSDLLEPAIRTGVIEVTADDVRFTHPLLGSVRYAYAGDRERRDMHALLAEYVQDPVERARHVSLAVGEPDEATAQQLEDAARQASVRGASAAAAGLAEHAARLTPPASSDARNRRMLEAARACLTAGDVPRAESVLGEALAAMPTGGPRAEALVLQHEVASRGGGTPDAVRLLQEALAHAADRPDLQALIHAELAVDRRLTEGLGVAERHARTAVELADLVGDLLGDAQLFNALGFLPFVLPFALQFFKRLFQLFALLPASFEIQQ